MDKLRALEVFVGVVDQGSFAAAARQLDMSSVMVGKYVAELEQQLGAQLLARSTRRQSLTDAGRRFHEEARKVLEQLAWAESTVERLRAAPSGLLRVSAATTVGECLLAPLLAEFRRQHPQVQVELDLSNSHVDPIESGFDLMVRVGALDPLSELVARPLGWYRMVVCAAPAYLAQHGRPETPADLVRHQCLGHLVWNRHSAWRLGRDGSQPWPETAGFLCNSGQALRAAALAGAGLLLQPRILVADDLATGRLISVLDDFTPPPRPVHALYRPDRQLLPKTRRFVELLVERLPGLLA